MGLHEFFHHSAIISCIKFHLWKSFFIYQWISFCVTAVSITHDLIRHFIVLEIKISSLYNPKNERKLKLTFYARISKTFVNFKNLLFHALWLFWCQNHFLVSKIKISSLYKPKNERKLKMTFLRTNIQNVRKVQRSSFSCYLTFLVPKLLSSIKNKNF